jgi:hypothetical protein
MTSRRYDLDLKCAWTSWSVTGEQSLRLDMPPSHCCDMTGAIRVARRLMPDVTMIESFAGGERDTAYQLQSSGAWRVIRPDGSWRDTEIGVS